MLQPLVLQIVFHAPKVFHVVEEAKFNVTSVITHFQVRVIVACALKASAVDQKAYLVLILVKMDILHQ